MIVREPTQVILIANRRVVVIVVLVVLVVVLVVLVLVVAAAAVVAVVVVVVVPLSGGLVRTSGKVKKNRTNPWTSTFTTCFALSGYVRVIDGVGKRLSGACPVFFFVFFFSVK